jgi:uncharacterized protein YcgI (DUF1989 family)
MASATHQSFIIPPKVGRAFEVRRGQRFRVMQVDGEQVADVTMLNRQDLAERFCAPVTCSQNGRNMTRVESLWSGPPQLRKIATITADTYKRHWLHGRCTALTYRTHHNIESPRNCALNISEALAAFGVAERDVPFDTLNLFMDVDLTPDGGYVFRATRARKDDYVELLAEVELMVAVSNCPDESVLNNYSTKPLRIEVLES